MTAHFSKKSRIVMWIRSILSWTGMILITLLFAPVITLLAPLSMKASWRVTRKGVKLILWVVGAELIVRNESGLDVPPAGAVYVSNHQSYLDVVSLIAAFEGGFRFLAKRTLLLLPAVNVILLAQKHLLINRARPWKALKKLLTHAPEFLSGESRIFLFPEGSRSWGGKTGEFRDGASALAIWAKAPVVPVAIVGSHEVLPRGNWPVRPGKITLVIGPPIETAGLHIRERRHLTAQLRGWIIETIEKVGQENKNL